MPYNHQEIEKKWQDKWEEAGVFHAKDDSKKEKFYCLVEFPYPSGAGLHMGHPRSYTALDIIARKRRMEGYEVLYPMGWDAFGLPTENYAIKTGRKPQDVTAENVATFKRQLQSFGFSFDWSREVNTTDPAYYKWTQWMFLEFFKNGLAYKDKMAINWCLSCKIGLANEEVVDGKCERCGGEIEKREKEQWMIAITKYADRLLEDLDTVDYLPKIKTQQVNWIGKSEGAKVRFDVASEKKHFVIIHGYTGTPETDFFPGMKAALEAAGHTVELPELPNTENPNVEEQIRFVKDSVSFSENTVVFAHSLGAPVALKVIEGLDHPVEKVVLAGGFVTPDFIDRERPFQNTFNWEYDFKKIKKNIGMLVHMCDTDDYAVPRSQAEKIQKEIGGEIIDVKANASHFLTENEPSLMQALLPEIEVFTTRQDTLFGATYMVLAPEHPLVEQLTTDDQQKAVQTYVKEAAAKSDIDRQNVEKEKTGVFTGAYAVNPVNEEKIPVWVADYVLMGYGTGAIMAVPAHDDRDFAFAKKYDLPIREVVQAPEGNEEECFCGEGKAINSGDFDGKETAQVKKEITKWLASQNKGEAAINYKLRDWVFSRQRYWGEPIPLVHCDACGWVPVPDAQLPVELPDVEKYEPTDTGESPLAAIDDWVNTTCPSCDAPAKRETDTMPNWAGSSWYFLRYIDPNNSDAFASKKLLKHWMPIDWYNGGMEHTVLHLLYSRFWNKFLFDQGHVPVSEPYARRTSHGLILAEDGSKMSKSKGNVVNPDEKVGEYGADAVRVYQMFIGPFSEPVPWSTNGLVGVRRFLEKVTNLADLISDKESEDVTRVLHQTIKKVTDDIEKMRFNTAVSQMMIFVNTVKEAGGVTKESFETFLTVLCPFAPHLSNELFESLGGKGFLEEQTWPAFNEALAKEDLVDVAVQVNGKVRGTISISPDADEETAKAAALADENVMKHIDGKDIKKVIYVQGRILNLIV